MWEEFKKFAFRGNVLDLAVGVILGAAFGKIITSLVNDVLMPLIGLITAGVDFKTLQWVIKEAVVVGDVITRPAVTVAYGSFLQNIFDFFLVALTIFLFVRAINRRRRKEEKKAEEEKARLAAMDVKAPTIPELLIEIRDMLKADKGE